MVRSWSGRRIKQQHPLLPVAVAKPAAWVGFLAFSYAKLFIITSSCVSFSGGWRFSAFPDGKLFFAFLSGWLGGRKHLLFMYTTLSSAATRIPEK